jgi:hypothetical protein
MMLLVLALPILLFVILFGMERVERWTSSPVRPEWARSRPGVGQE